MTPSSVTPLDGVFAPEREGEVVDDRAHLPALDGLRGLAILLVVMLHLTMQIKHPSSVLPLVLKRVFVTGWAGVDLFFVLSGFLITGILDDAKGTANYFRVFYARRMLRILPLYYGALLVLFMLPHLATNAGAPRFFVPLKDQLWYWFYLQNFHPLPPLFVGLAGHLWTLAIEEQFYLVWPVIILVLSRKSALWLCALILPLSIVYRTVASVVNPTFDMSTNTFAHLDGLAVGSALALLYRTPGATDWIKRRLSVFAGTSLIGLMVLYGFRLAFVRQILLGTLLAVLFGSLLVYALEQREGWAARFFRSRLMRFFGRYSYGMYVLHVPLIPLGYLIGITPTQLTRVLGSQTAAVVLYVAFMLPTITAAAWLSYNGYEKHFLRLKRRFVYRRPLEAVPHSDHEQALRISV